MAAVMETSGILSELGDLAEPLEDEAFTDFLAIPESVDDTSHVKKEGLPPLVAFKGKKMPRMRPFPSKAKPLKYGVSCPEVDTSQLEKDLEALKARPSIIDESDVKILRIGPVEVENEKLTPKKSDYSDKLKDIRTSLLAATEEDHFMILERKLTPLIKDWCDKKETEVNFKKITGMQPNVLDEFMQDWKTFEDLLCEHGKVVSVKSQKRRKSKDSHRRCTLL